MIPVGVLAGQAAAAAAPVLGFGAAAGLVAQSTASSPYTWTLPTNAAGDLILLFGNVRRYDTAYATPSGYTACGSVASGTTGVSGAGTGSIRAQAFYKVSNGSESNPTGSYTTTWWYAGNGSSIVLTKDSGTWGVDNTTASSETTTVNVTGAATLNYAPGDMVVVHVAHKDDDATHTSPTITIPGCTVGTVTERLATNTTTSANDGASYVYTAEITAGNASGAPQFACTVGGSEGWVAVNFLRVHAT